MKARRWGLTAVDGRRDRLVQPSRRPLVAGAAASASARPGLVRGGLSRARNALRPDRAIGPDMNLPHRADHAGANPFVDERGALAGMALVAHLGDDLGALGRLAQHAGLVDRPGQRLLHVDVLAQLHGRLGDHGVGVVGRGDDHAVDILLLFEHLAIIGVALRLAVSLLKLDGGWVRLAIAAPGSAGHGRVHVPEVHIGQRDDVLPPVHDLGRVGRALAAAADDGDVDRLARRQVAGPAQDMTRNDHGAEGGPGRSRDETPSGDLVLSHVILPRRPGLSRTRFVRNGPRHARADQAGEPRPSPTTRARPCSTGSTSGLRPQGPRPGIRTRCPQGYRTSCS